MNKEESNIGSLLSAPMMGGIIGAGGYDFQTRYIVCHFPEWVKNPDFECFVSEATGDVDLKYKKGEGFVRHHVQVKDHNVTPGELREVVETFIALDRAHPGVYEKFVLAAPSFSDDVKSLDIGLRRIRGVEQFYVDVPDTLSLTVEDLRTRAEKVQLESSFEFVFEKLELEPGLTDFHRDDRSLDIFRGRIINHPLYEDRFKALIDHAYAHLMRHVLSHRGRVVDTKKLDEIIHESFKEALQKTEPRLVINFHNWTCQKFALEADKVLDWSKYFDREQRITPDVQTWQKELLPQIKKMKDELLQERAEKVIFFQGQACLSTGILAGATFPRSGGWVFEFKQPTADVSWRSDAKVDDGYKVQIEKQDLAENGDSIVLLFNVTGKAREAVLKSVDELKINGKALLVVTPPSLPGSHSIKNDVEAVSFAQAARDALYETLSSAGVEKTHVFFYGPQSLAIFFGQRLTAVKKIQLYEFKDPGYAESCSFNT